MNNESLSKPALILTCGAVMFGGIPVSTGSSFEAGNNDAIGPSVLIMPSVEPAAKVLEEPNLQ